VTATTLKGTLESLRVAIDLHARLDVDPLGVVRRYADPLDREIIGLVAAGVAFGNVKTIRNKLEEIATRVGDRPHEKADDPRALGKALAGFRHRVFIGDDIARLMIGARRVQKRHDSLGRRFAALFHERSDLRESLATLADDIRTAGDLKVRGGRRGPAHLLPDPRAGSGVKRLLLYLRWMVRPADGVDLGQWDVPTRALLIPVDTHIHKLARNLGLTSRKDLSWRTAEEITHALAAFDQEDPVKYDFSLCHMGMLQRCPSRHDPKRCNGCPVMPVCRHWA
jgi:uncharacterized protein (TIGR02757 family)